MAEEAKLTVTLKSEQHNGPWLVVRGDNPVELQSLLEAVSANGLGAVVANADTAFKGGVNAGAQLGATPVEAPQNPAPQAAQAASQNPWAGAPQADAGQANNPWGGAPAQANAPAPQAGTFDSGGAPMVLGMPAKKVTGTSKKSGRPWSAWADPRPKEATQHIQDRTDDPNDPRLAAGQATFWKFTQD